MKNSSTIKLNKISNLENYFFMNLPKWINDLLINIILPFAKIAGKNGIVEVLKNLKAKNENLYRTLIIVGYRALVVELKPLADDTTTPWDNEAVDLVIAALLQSATDNNVPLPDVTIIALPAPTV